MWKVQPIYTQTRRPFASSEHGHCKSDNLLQVGSYLIRVWHGLSVCGNRQTQRLLLSNTIFPGLLVNEIETFIHGIDDMN